MGRIRLRAGIVMEAGTTAGGIVGLGRIVGIALIRRVCRSGVLSLRMRICLRRRFPGLIRLVRLRPGMGMELALSWSGRIVGIAAAGVVGATGGIAVRSTLMGLLGVIVARVGTGLMLAIGQTGLRRAL